MDEEAEPMKGRNAAPSDQKIKVAMIIQAYSPKVGGAERQLASLAPLLRDQGIDVQIYTRRYPGLSPYQEMEGVPIIRLPIPGPKPAASLAFSLSALPHLARYRPDIIHAHELLSPTTTALLAKRIWGVPVLAKILRGGTLGDLAVLDKKPLGKLRWTLQQKHVNYFLVITREIDRELEASGIPAERRFFLPNGVDTEHFTPAAAREKTRLKQELGIAEGPCGIYVGRLSPEKRVDLLLDTWPLVRSRQPRATLLILGDGPQKKALETAAPPGVRFPGQVRDVAPYLQAADVFLLPSQTEGLSNALLEAMASGLAVIVTSVGGAADLITHQENGWLIPADDGENLTEAVRELFRQQGLRQKMGRAARETITSGYALPLIADRLVGLYRQVAAARED